MGYRSSRDIYKLVWPEGHDLHGLEIRARSCPIGEMFELNRLSQKLTGGAPDMDSFGRVLDIFAKAIVRWNLEDVNGNDVAPGRAGLDELSTAELLAVVTVWAQTITQVSTPLARRSTPNGIQEIPMEPTTAAP